MNGVLPNFVFVDFFNVLFGPLMKNVMCHFCFNIIQRLWKEFLQLKDTIFFENSSKIVSILGVAPRDFFARRTKSIELVHLSELVV